MHDSYSVPSSPTSPTPVDWRSVVEARHKLRRNWLSGRAASRTFEGHRQVVTCVQFDESRIVSGSSDSTIKVWSTKTNASWSVMTLLGHSDAVRCLVLRGNVLVSGSSDQTIKVWMLEGGLDWSRGSCRLTIQSHTDCVRCLCLEQDTILSGSYDGTIRTHSFTTGAPQLIYRGHDGAVLALACQNKATIVSGGVDGTVRVWDRAKAQCRLVINAHARGVSGVHVDPHRRIIISTGFDGNISFWRDNGECVEVLTWIHHEGHRGAVRGLMADDKRLVTCSDDKTVKVWDLDTRQRLCTLQ
jgi:F-box/WD-40 domain protein 7